MATPPFNKLQDTLGYRFRDERLLRLAMTHSSLGEEENYERLEFLGDRVLGLVMAETLYKIFPGETEGDLAKRHAALVQGDTLAEIADKIDLGSATHLSDAERAAGGEANRNILADVMEALLGALYLDGGLDVCSDIVKNLWEGMFHTMKEPPQDPKTALQEWAQGRGLPLPIYELTDRQGPDHAPLFEMKVTVEGLEPAFAKGSSRRSAEKEAASILLSRLPEEKKQQGKRQK